ncbi:hypothetical protein ABH922_004445 [Rhodococcus sp. 27YEA15]
MQSKADFARTAYQVAVDAARRLGFAHCLDVLAT